MVFRSDELRASGQCNMTRAVLPIVRLCNGDKCLDIVVIDSMQNPGVRFREIRGDARRYYAFEHSHLECVRE